MLPLALVTPLSIHATVKSMIGGPDGPMPPHQQKPSPSRYWHTMKAVQSVDAARAQHLNICEGKKDIDALITACNLVPIALNTVIPKVKRFCPIFPWHFDEFMVCDTNWVDLAEHQSLVPYFYSQCLQPACKNPKAMMFKPKQFTLYVVVPAVQWLEYEVPMEKEESDVMTTKDVSLANASSNEGGSEQLVASPCTPSMVPLAFTRSIPFHMQVAQTTFMPTHIGTQIVPCNDEAMKTMDALVRTAATTPAMKQTVVSPPPAATLLPRKIPALTPFMSPSWTHLQEALKSGGTSELNVDNGERFVYIPELKKNGWNWKEYCECILEVASTQNLLGHLAGVEQKLKVVGNEQNEWLWQNSNVQSILMWNIPDSLFLHIRHFKTAHEMFDYLATKFQDHTPIPLPTEKCVEASNGDVAADELPSTEDIPEQNGSAFEAHASGDNM
ncbi:hypothetical protein EDC04DRAFT_2941959 [Pisolithus marmoratus]|nr:hypothetical protein EDC04DRAFT_2941959 [Pisolithus marmoratus]